MKTLAQTIIYDDKDAVLAKLAADPSLLNDYDEYGYTPLVESAIANKADIGAALLAAGADVKGKDLTGRTALHWAADNNNQALCRILLEHGADVNAYTIGGLSVLVMPVLRQQQTLKELLFQYGGSLSFAQDFIHAKLLGHRFELIGTHDIYSPQDRFVEIEYEGFFLEFTVGLIRDSVERFIYNFGAKQYRQQFDALKHYSVALHNAAKLARYQHYLLDINTVRNELDPLLQFKPLLLPVGYEGHAISFIYYGQYWLKCDRGEARKKHGSIVLYKMAHPERVTADFLKHLLYTPSSRHFIEEELEVYLGLTPLAQLPIMGQVIGNCSWANIEASMPAYLWLLSYLQNPGDSAESFSADSLELFEFWRQWDQDRALEECIGRFEHANAPRRASIVALLADILFQTCLEANRLDITRAEKILPILLHPEYRYVLITYIETYIDGLSDERGPAFHHLLDLCGVDIKKLRENG